jgi:transposase-like protein
MEKSKIILGLKKSFEFSLEERKLIIEEYLTSGKTKREIWEKYTGEKQEHGSLLRWMRQIGYDIAPKWSKFAPKNTTIMTKKESEIISEKTELLEKIAMLEKALVNSELKSTMYETMIEIAEKELKISIKKKFNTK